MGIYIILLFFSFFEFYVLFWFYYYINFFSLCTLFISIVLNGKWIFGFSPSHYNWGKIHEISSLLLSSETERILLYLVAMSSWVIMSAMEPHIYKSGTAPVNSKSKWNLPNVRDTMQWLTEVHCEKMCYLFWWWDRYTICPLVNVLAVSVISSL